jgi:uncharacterized protein YbcI
MNINPHFAGYSVLNDDVQDSATDLIAQAVWDFELERTGCRPEGVSVILNKNILVIKRHKALAPSERFLAATDSWLHRFPRHRLISSSDELWHTIERITGRQLYECTAEVDVHIVTFPAFFDGALVQVFQLV